MNLNQKMPTSITKIIAVIVLFLFVYLALYTQDVWMFGIILTAIITLLLMLFIRKIRNDRTRNIFIDLWLSLLVFPLLYLAGIYVILNPGIYARGNAVMILLAMAAGIGAIARRRVAIIGIILWSGVVIYLQFFVKDITQDILYLGLSSMLFAGTYVLAFVLSLNHKIKTFAENTYFGSTLLSPKDKK